MLIPRVTGTSNVKNCGANSSLLQEEYFFSQPVVLKAYSGNDRFHDYIHHMDWKSVVWIRHAPIQKKPSDFKELVRHSNLSFWRFVWYFKDGTYDVTLHNDLFKNHGFLDPNISHTLCFGTCHGVHTYKWTVSSDFDKYSWV